MISGNLYRTVTAAFKLLQYLSSESKYLLLILPVGSSPSHLWHNGVLCYKRSGSGHIKPFSLKGTVQFQQGILICPGSVNGQCNGVFPPSVQLCQLLRHNRRYSSAVNRCCNNSQMAFRLCHCPVLHA